MLDVQHHQCSSVVEYDLCFIESAAMLSRMICANLMLEFCFALNDLKRVRDPVSLKTYAQPENSEQVKCTCVF